MRVVDVVADPVRHEVQVLVVREKHPRGLVDGVAVDLAPERDGFRVARLQRLGFGDLGVDSVAAELGVVLVVPGRTKGSAGKQQAEVIRR